MIRRLTIACDGVGVARLPTFARPVILRHATLALAAPGNGGLQLRNGAGELCYECLSEDAVTSVNFAPVAQFYDAVTSGGPLGVAAAPLPPDFTVLPTDVVTVQGAVGDGPVVFTVEE